MSECRFRYTNKHGVTKNGMNEESTCRRTGSPIDERTMHAKKCAHERMIMQICVREWTNEQTWNMCSLEERWTNMHFLRTNEPVKPSSIQERRNVWMQHQGNQQPSKTKCMLPCGGEAMTHHEDIHHQQHCILTCTPTTTWMYQHNHVNSCHESCHPHLYYGPYCQQCNVMWKSKRPNCCMKSHVKLKSHGSQIVMRVFE